MTYLKDIRLWVLVGIVFAIAVSFFEHKEQHVFVFPVKGTEGNYEVIFVKGDDIKSCQVGTITSHISRGRKLTCQHHS